MKKRIFVLLVNIFLFITFNYAQHLEKDCFICQSGHSYHDHESPYKTLSFKSESPILGSIVGLTATSLLLKAPRPLTVSEINLLDKNDVNAFDRYATSLNSASAQRASDIFLTGVLVLPSIFLSNHSTRKDVVPLVIMSAETVLINLALTNITKKLAQRTRPLAYNSNFALEEKTKENARLSFYSGHTSHTASLSFLIAKIMTDYHPHARKGIKIGIWSFSAAIPAVTGYLRVRAGKHFPTDTITGFIAGGLVGILVPHFHQKRKDLKYQKVIITPSLGVGVAAIKVQF